MSIKLEWFLGMSCVILNWTALSEMVYNEIKYIDVSELSNLFIMVVKDCSVDVMHLITLGILIDFV